MSQSDEWTPDEPSGSDPFEQGDEIRLVLTTKAPRPPDAPGPPRSGGPPPAVPLRALGARRFWPAVAGFSLCPRETSQRAHGRI